MALELLQHRRILRVEWAIVGLIVVEIALTLVQRMLRDASAQPAADEGQHSSPERTTGCPGGHAHR